MGGRGQYLTLLCSALLCSFHCLTLPPLVFISGWQGQLLLLRLLLQGLAHGQPPTALVGPGSIAGVEGQAGLQITISYVSPPAHSQQSMLLGVYWSRWGSTGAAWGQGKAAAVMAVPRGAAEGAAVVAGAGAGSWVGAKSRGMLQHSSISLMTHLCAPAHPLGFTVLMPDHEFT